MRNFCAIFASTYIVGWVHFQDHTIKKLLLIFWEICPKTYPDGKLMQEMILVCDAYRKDLQHPNEFIRGSTLRFLCKLKVKGVAQPGNFTTKTLKKGNGILLSTLQFFKKLSKKSPMFNFKVTLWHMLPIKSYFVLTFLHLQHS